MYSKIFRTRKEYVKFRRRAKDRIVKISLNRVWMYKAKKQVLLFKYFEK